MAELASVSVFLTTDCCCFMVPTQESLKYICHWQFFWKTAPAKSCSKDKSCAGSPSTRGERLRMAGEVGAGGGKGVAAESLSSEAWGWAGEGGKCRKPESVGIFIIVK